MRYISNINKDQNNIKLEYISNCYIKRQKKTRQKEKRKEKGEYKFEMCSIFKINNCLYKLYFNFMIIRSLFGYIVRLRGFRSYMLASCILFWLYVGYICDDCISVIFYDLVL